jgi:hypothetical protein
MNSMDSVRNSTLYRLLQYNKKTRQFKKKFEGYIYFGFYQCCGSGSGFYPGSLGSQDPEVKNDPQKEKKS